MSPTLARTVSAFAVLVGGLVCLMMGGVSGQAGVLGQPRTAAGDWPMYTADLTGSRYSPLAQITASNFNQLEVAWRFKTDHLGSRPEYKLEGTPVAVNGILYATAGTRRSVVALDGRTGELIWSHSLREGARAVAAPRQLSGRGLSYWTDGKGDDRVLYVTTGYRLVALRARDGQLIEGFANGGVLDLKVGVVRGEGQQIDLDTGEIGLHATPTVVKDVVIVGSSFREGLAVQSRENTKGVVRAFDIRTGKRLWQFNTIPGPGEFGNDTWLDDSWKTTGNVGVWTQITVDEELGLVYLPVESPTSDLYGGHRPGNNLFAESLVCVDLETGQRKWHFQFVHHPIWDHDMSSAPLLMDVVIDGKPRKIVAVPSKQSFLYVFDRVTGQPIWPIEEQPAPKGTVPGEWYSPTQPIPTRPAAYARTYVRVPDDLIDFTPEMRQEAVKNMEMFTWAPSPYNPPVVSLPEGPIAAMTIGTLNGGTNWPGAAYDPELHTVFVQACNACVAPLGLVQPPRALSDLNYIMGSAGEPVRLITGGGEGSAADSPESRRTSTPAAGPPRGQRRNYASVQGLPLLKPPYGVLSAVNLDRGELVWQVPHGETPDNVRNHPMLKGLDLPRTGQAVSLGLLVTKTLVVGGDGQVTARSGRPRGAMLRAYDKLSGKEVGAVFMPAGQSGSPMTYAADGRQYVVVAVSGGSYSGEYIAYALPEQAQ